MTGRVLAYIDPRSVMVEPLSGRKLLPHGIEPPKGPDFHGYTFVYPDPDDPVMRCIAKRYYAESA